MDVLNFVVEVVTNAVRWTANLIQYSLVAAVLGCIICLLGMLILMHNRRNIKRILERMKISLYAKIDSVKDSIRQMCFASRESEVMVQNRTLVSTVDSISQENLLLREQLASIQESYDSSYNPSMSWISSKNVSTNQGSATSHGSTQNYCSQTSSEYDWSLHGPLSMPDAPCANTGAHQGYTSVACSPIVYDKASEIRIDMGTQTNIEIQVQDFAVQTEESYEKKAARLMEEQRRCREWKSKGKKEKKDR